MNTSFLTDPTLLKIGLATMLAGIVYLIYVKYLEKENPNPSKMDELKDLGGYNYRQFTLISQMIIGVGWLAVLAYIVGCLFEWLGWI